MLEKALLYQKGYVRVRLKGKSPERFLNLCRYHRLQLWEIQSEKNGVYSASMDLASFRAMKGIRKKTNTQISIQRKWGLPFLLFRYRKRKLFLFGCLWGLCLLFLSTEFVWSIDFQGNRYHTDEALLVCLREHGICGGMRKNRIDCNQVVSLLRKQYDDIIWVSACFQGSHLQIAIKENCDDIAGQKERQQEEFLTAPIHLVAERDGVILSMITASGTPKVRQGERVKQGQILVEGIVPVVDDSGAVTDYHTYQAKADIFAEVTELYENHIERLHEVKRYTGRVRHGLFLNGYKLFGRKYDKGQWEEVLSVRKPALGKTLPLPLTFGVKRAREYERVKKLYTTRELQDLLSEAFQEYCQKLLEKGVKISENNVKIYIGEKQGIARGTVRLIAPIGVEKAGELPPNPPKLPKE